MTEKVKLSGGPEKTATWIWLDPETGGQLRVEYYDFSESAQKAFGNDIAYILTIHEMKKLFFVTKQNGDSLIGWMAENFRSYFDIKKWLEENRIGFHRAIDSRA